MISPGRVSGTLVATLVILFADQDSVLYEWDTRNVPVLATAIVAGGTFSRSPFDRLKRRQAMEQTRQADPNLVI